MELDLRSKIDESYPPLISIMLENMLKQNQKERWSYDDLTKFGKISKSLTKKETSEFGYMLLPATAHMIFYERKN